MSNFFVIAYHARVREFVPLNLPIHKFTSVIVNKVSSK